MNTLTVFTWNILAPEWTNRATEGLRDFHRHAHPWVSWSERRPRVLAALADVRADVLCLQEVSSPFHREHLATALEAQGRDHVFVSRRSGEAEIGVLVAWRRDRFEGVPLPDFGGPGLERRVAAASLRARTGGPTITVVTGHLPWANDEVHRRTWLDAVFAGFGERPADAERDATVQLVAGDVNFDPHAHPDWPRWAAEGWVTSHPQADMPTWAADGRTERLDAVLVRGAVSAIDGPRPPELAPMPGLPSVSMPSDHVPLVARVTLR